MKWSPTQKLVLRRGLREIAKTDLEIAMRFAAEWEIDMDRPASLRERREAMEQEARPKYRRYRGSRHTKTAGAKGANLPAKG